MIYPVRKEVHLMLVQMGDDKVCQGVALYLTDCMYII